ncbi:uncharacterized protein N7459_006612 [Penicillium hispanicum]|uniref:uncharacterized protein n=1 Tax=Penicillium hispanicum TaxID=1080232 RepID=UPI002541B4BE|nr:uncharacterized protein N7459_006612 [Penicillium hispanicum]KAJ5577648.1 hypothetical protein N7459_006612 [Penicillium hispanicum]
MTQIPNPPSLSSMDKIIATSPFFVLLALIVVLISTVFLSVLGFDISIGNKRAQGSTSSSGPADLDEKQRLEIEMEFLKRTLHDLQERWKQLN